MQQVGGQQYRTESPSGDNGSKAAVSGNRARRLTWYILLVDAVALIVIVASASTLPEMTLPNLVVFIGLTTLAELSVVRLRGGGEFSLSFTVNFAGAVLFGPAFAALAAAGAVLTSDLARRRKSFVQTMFGAGQMALCGAAAGLTFSMLRNENDVALASNVLAYVAAAAVYVAVNSGLACGVLALLGQPFIRVWLRTLRDGGIIYFAEAPLGVLLANAYSQSPWALLYFPAIVLVFYRGTMLYQRLRTETDQALVVLANTIDKRDRYTFEHSVRVSAYVKQIAERLGLSQDDLDLIVSAAQVHDLGKISIDNRILLKEGPITPEERLKINTHAAAGAELAGQFSMYRQGAEIIRHHHERWDGTGYPDGLASEAIPLGARIIAVADVYDAMTSDRPYRKALPHDVAVNELVKGRGTQFDAKLVDVFLSLGITAEECATASPPIGRRGRASTSPIASLKLDQG